MSESKTYFLLVGGDDVLSSEIVTGTLLDLQKAFAKLTYFGDFEGAKTEPEIGELISEIGDAENHWCGGEWQYKGEQWHCYAAEITDDSKIQSLESRIKELENELKAEREVVDFYADESNFKRDDFLEVATFQGITGFGDPVGDRARARQKDRRV